VTFVLSRNVASLETVKAMDLLSFRSLHDSCVRLETASKIERLMDTRSAYHAEARSFSKMVKKMIRDATPKDQPNAADGTKEDFLRQFPKGF
jgi:hypothetical protein